MEDRAAVFRGEAIKHQGLGTNEGGAVLRLSPAWTQWAFWLLLAVVGFYAALGVFGRVSEYATGPALIRVEGQQVRVLAVLPGGYAPLLSEGVPLRLELQGFPYQYQALTLDELGRAAVDPREVRQELGEGLVAGLDAAGTVVRVRALVPSDSFAADGQRLKYIDGMRGTVSVRVKTERLATTLIPGLKRLLP